MFNDSPDSVYRKYGSRNLCICNIVKLTLNFPAKFLGDKYYYGNYNMLEFEPSFYDLIYS